MRKEILLTEALHPASGDRPPIQAECQQFACMICRTKTGWPHQVWCEAAQALAPGCADCRYWSAEKDRCDHPMKRGGGEGP